jgi:hypothetical protein
MFALLHRHHPWDIVKSHGFESEVRVIWDLIDFEDERVEVKGFDAVDGGDEIRGREAILIGWTSPALKGEIR